VVGRFFLDPSKARGETMQVPNNSGPRPLLHRVTVIFTLLALFTVAAQDTMAGTPCTQSTIGFTISALAGSATYISLPVTPTPVFCGAVASTPGTTTIPVSGSPSLGGQTCYVLMTSGAKEGAIYSISSVSGSTVTINSPQDQYCDDLTGINSGDGLAIIPYWTLNTVWPGGSGITGANTAANGTDILVWDNATQSFVTFWYRTTGTTPGWRNAISAITVVNNQIIQPYQTIVVLQHATGPNLSFTVTGSEIENQSRTCLLNSLSGPFYNFVSNTHYYPTGGQSLDQSGLASGFVPSNYSSSTIVEGDELLLFDNIGAVVNKAPSKTYYIDANTSTWQSIPSGGSGSDVVFTPGTGVVIRKAGGSSTPTYWIDPYP
jgi:uncharacterized protein (TIGR02597 family)